MRKIIFASCLFVFVFSCKTPKKVPVINRGAELSEVDVLKSELTGHFMGASSKIGRRIEMNSQEIWHQKQGNWIYSEQEITQSEKKTIRQEVFQLEQVNSKEFIVRIYELVEPKKWLGKWRRPLIFNRFDESILKEQIGCELYLKKGTRSSFFGNTEGKNCKTASDETDYRLVKMDITLNGIKIWEQGFSKEGTSVWGSLQDEIILRKR